jgi:hypothetical protein
VNHDTANMVFNEAFFPGLHATSALLD